MRCSEASSSHPTSKAHVKKTGKLKWHLLCLEEDRNGASSISKTRLLDLEVHWQSHSNLFYVKMAQLLAGKAAAITGAVTGIGRAIAVDYLKHGAKVAVNYFPDDISAQQFEDLQREVGQDASLIGVAGDISIPATGQELVKKAVEKFGRLDIFVSNAGVCQFADFLTCVLGGHIRLASRCD